MENFVRTITIVFILFCCSFTVNAEDLFVKIWNVSDMPTGEINSYEGLDIIQAKTESSKKVIVSDSIKNYEGWKFTKCIKTQGDSNYTNCVPQERAVKIYVEKPCVLNVYMMSGSSSAANPKAIVSRQGEIITRFDLRYSVLQKYSVYIDKSDYYLEVKQHIF